MMSDISRRDFARLAGIGGLGALAWSASSPFAVAQGAAKVVVVGGGAGGATVAHYIKKEAPELDVTLIETTAGDTRSAALTRAVLRAELAAS